MNLHLTLATAQRVLAQIRHDHRTMALLVAVPSLLMTLLWWIYRGGRIFDQIGAPLLGIFPLVIMFLITSVTTLRERTSGTLERLMTMPIGRADFVVGYALALGFAALIQTTVVATYAIVVLDLQVAGPEWMLVGVSVLSAILGVTMGLAASSLARTEFQAVQFMPALIFPQFLLCGLLVPRGADATGRRVHLRLPPPELRRRRGQGGGDVPRPHDRLGGCGHLPVHRRAARPRGHDPEAKVGLGVPRGGLE